MKTPFYELAEWVANNPTEGLYCQSLHWLENSEKEYWLFTFGTFDDFENDNHYLTALLFADLLWQDEMKGGKK